MDVVHRGAVLASVVLTAALVGCATAGSAEHAPEIGNVDPALTWQEAKAATQATELEIATLIPKEVVVKVDQMKDGTLFSCDSKQHRWMGVTTIEVKATTDIDQVVEHMETLFRDSRFDIRTRENVAGKYEVHLMDPSTAEGYIFGEGIYPNTILIDSGSACFTLPEGTYPGGLF